MRIVRREHRFFVEVHPGKHDPKLYLWHLPRSHVSTNQLGALLSSAPENVLHFLERFLNHEPAMYVGSTSCLTNY